MCLPLFQQIDRTSDFSLPIHWSSPVQHKHSSNVLLKGRRKGLLFMPDPTLELPLWRLWQNLRDSFQSSSWPGHVLCCSFLPRNVLFLGSYGTNSAHLALPLSREQPEAATHCAWALVLALLLPCGPSLGCCPCAFKCFLFITRSLLLSGANFLLTLSFGCPKDWPRDWGDGCLVKTLPKH